MLLTNNRPNDINALLSDRITPPPPFHTPHRRISHTAKTNTRLSTPNAARTISLKPEAPSYLSPSLRMNRSSQLFPNDESPMGMSQAFGKLDHLQLQDFLKMVIVGDRKVPEDRSNEIIRSLNGTWFKNTQATEKSSFRFFSSLGMRRTRPQSRPRQHLNLMEGQDPSDLFKREYSPPNRFPPKKYTSKKSYSMKIVMDDLSSTPLEARQDSPLRARMMQEGSRSQRKPVNQAFKRSFSHLQKKKEQFLSHKKMQEPVVEGLVKGRRMIIYKD